MKTKRFFLALCMLCGVTTGFSQTNFRDITYEKALQAAKQEGKLLFIDFFTDWCGPCKMMALDVFPQPKVGEYMNANYVCIKLNAEKEGAKLAKQYNVQAYPTFIVANASEQVQFEVKGAMDGDTFIDKIKSGLDPSKKPEMLAKRYASGERTPALINSYALSKMEAQQEEEGFKIIDDYFNSLTDQQKVAVENTFLYTRYTLSVDNPRAQYLVKNRKKFSPKVTEELDNHLRRLYRNEINTYFSGYRWSEKKYNEQAYQQLKQQMTAFGLTKAHAYAPVFKLIEARVAKDDEAFFNDCQATFSQLDAQDKNLLIMNITRLIQTEDAQLHAKMASFVCQHLAELSPSAIMVSRHILKAIGVKE